MYKLQTKWFRKWAKKQKISNERLCEAIENVDLNLSSESLGGGLYKVRVASLYGGKRSSFRTILVYRKEDRAVMVYGFAKNEKENLSMTELKHFKILAKDILSLSEEALRDAIVQEVFYEIGV
jgi:hypothetical protein